MCAINEHTAVQTALYLIFVDESVKLIGVLM